MSRPAVFLDRDGVLIENREHYVREWEHVLVFERSVEACLRLQAAGFPLVVVTNQSAVGRGILDWEVVSRMNEMILDAFREQGVSFLAAYVCPHAPEAGCDCRKPQPGMLTQAAREHDLNLSTSFMIGDALSDMQAAEAAGAKGILVRTGRGEEQIALHSELSGSRWPVTGDLLEAVDLILGERI